jgi:hypothetical protein
MKQLITGLVLGMLLCIPSKMNAQSSCQVECAAAALSLETSCGAADVLNGFATIVSIYQGVTNVSNNVLAASDFAQECSDLAMAEESQCEANCVQQQQTAQSTEQSQDVNGLFDVNYYAENNSFVSSNYSSVNGYWGAGGGSFFTE